MSEKSLFKLRTGRVHECFGPLRRYTRLYLNTRETIKQGWNVGATESKEALHVIPAGWKFPYRPSSLAVVVETLKPLQNITRPRRQSGGSSRHWRAHKGKPGLRMRDGHQSLLCWAGLTLIKAQSVDSLARI